MKIQLSTQPVPLSQFGQDDCIIYNDGPDTVYLDTDGSVSASSSLAVAPLTYAPWPAGQPLYAVSRGTSYARIVNTNQTPVYSGASHQSTLIDLSTFTESSSSPVATLLECASYATLRVTWSVQRAFLLTGYYELLFLWYAEDGTTVVGTDRMASALSDVVLSVTQPNTVSVPVKGHFVTVYLRSVGGGAGEATDFKVIGLTEDYPMTITPGWNTSGTVWGTGDPVHGGTSTVYGSDWASFAYSGGVVEDIAFHSLARRMRVEIVFGAAPGAGARFGIGDIYGSFITAAITPANTATRQEWDFVVPLSKTCILHWFTAPAVGSITEVHITWY